MSPPRTLLRHHFTAFGGSDCAILCLDGNEADIAVLVAEVYAFESILTRFDARSELSQFNTRAGDRERVSPLLNELLRVALRAYAMSDGLVNAAVHTALVGSGYDASIEIVQARETSVVTAEHRAVIAIDRVLEVGDGWASLQPDHAVDLGGVGKGWLADRLAERFDDCVINLGGDLCVRGGGPDGEGWPVGLCDGSVVAVRDAGVATSGTAGRSWRGGHHLIDPRTGRPAVSDVTAMSVVAADALTAEILAKSAVILGASAAPDWLAEHGAVTWRGLPEVRT